MPRYVTAGDGVRLACQVAGQGPPLMMVHGAGSGRSSLDLVRPHLEPRLTVWALDRRGRGDSEDANRYALELEVEDVAAAVRAAGPATLLFGHSYGGLLAAAGQIYWQLVNSGSTPDRLYLGKADACARRLMEIDESGPHG